MTDPINRGATNPAGVLGQSIIDTEKVKALGAQVARATADLEAMRLLSLIPEFTSRFADGLYTVTVGTVTKTDPFLSRAVIMAAQEAGIAPAPPTKPAGEKP